MRATARPGTPTPGTSAGHRTRQFRPSAFAPYSTATAGQGVNQSAANPGGPPGPGSIGQVPNQVTQIHAKPFNAASVVTDGMDIEASYQFDLQDYDVPGNFTLRSLAAHVSKYIFDTG